MAIQSNSRSVIMANICTEQMGNVLPGGRSTSSIELLLVVVVLLLAAQSSVIAADNGNSPGTGSSARTGPNTGTNSSTNTIPADTTDDIPLRPRKDLNADSQSNGSITDSGASQDAGQAVDTDFAQHKAASRNGTIPKAASGASATAAAVLRSDVPKTEGPSKALIGLNSTNEIQLQTPALQSLITINDYLNPFQLDASSSNALGLRRALEVGIRQNLDLAISQANSKEKQLGYFSALGNFLPDPNAGFRELFLDGSIGLPTSSFGGAAAIGGGGAAAGGGSTKIRLHRPFEIMHAGADFYAYRGGSVLFGALQSRHTFRAAKHQENVSLSETLLTITRNYYNLVLAETLLQIRIDAVRRSAEQLRLNEDRFHAGLATQLDVLQSRTQLLKDQQALVDQQTNRRSFAITLAESINCDLGQDLIPADTTVKKTRLIDPRLNIADLLQVAIDHRPELKQYEELRLAAKKAIMVSAANLQPTVLLSGSAYGVGPPSNIPGLGIFSIDVNWRLKGMGTVDAFNVKQARWQARQALLESQKQLQSVLSQVRSSYLQILDKEKNVDQASAAVDSSLEELRLAELRKRSGLGTNLDIITGQRDYTQALVDKAQALINFDIAQVQLVHDIGLISTDSLTSGRLLSKAQIK